MADTNFGKILIELSQIHKDMPDLRFGEVIQSAIDSNKKIDNINFFDVSSKSILSALKKYYNKNYDMRKNNGNKK